MAVLTALWPALVAGREPSLGARAEFRVGLAIVARCEAQPRASGAVVRCEGAGAPARIRRTAGPGDPPAADSSAAAHPLLTIEF